MMIKDIFITSNAYLIPNHYGWKKLKDYRLNFDLLGNLSSGIYKTDKNKSLFCKIFVNDLINFSEKEASVRKKIKTITKNLVELITQRLKNTNYPVIVFVSSFINQNIFESMSKSSILEELHQKLINDLNKLNSKYNNIYILDLNKVFQNEGFDKIYDARNYYLANCRLSSRGIEILSECLYKVLKKINSPSKKVLVLDCDNTLWGGVIGEDGIKSILLGQDGIGRAFLDFQKNIKKLLDKGVILCIASKNNYADVLEVFQKHQEMQIKEKDIILFKVNWKEKYLNLVEISNDLNVGLDSIVFWDDNPFERQKMRTELPDICTIEPSKEVIYWPEQLNKLELFSNFTEITEDKNKLYQYKIRTKFVVERNNAQNELAYLKKIKLKAKKINILKGNISRASQMTQKTNQFNLSTKRYSISDIQTINKDKKNKVSLFKISDIYGDHGIVGMYILKEKNKNSIYLDTFLLSCRVFGRYLETWMLNSIKSKYHRNINIYAEYVPTKKNILVKDFLENHNFELIKKNKKTSLYKIKSYNIKNKIMKIYD